MAYLEDRSDNIANCDHHGFGPVYDVELAMMRDGTMRGLKIDVVDDYGAYIQLGVGHHGNAPGPGGRAVHHRQRALPGPGGADQQEPAGRSTGASGSEVNNWMLEQMVRTRPRANSA